MFQCLGLATEQDGGCGEDWWHPECVVGIGRGWRDQVSRPKVEGDSSERNTGHTNGASEQARDEEEVEEPLPPGFPPEEHFETFICYKCVDVNPWLKRYAGNRGFLLPVIKLNGSTVVDQDKNLSNDPAHDNFTINGTATQDVEEEQQR